MNSRFKLFTLVLALLALFWGSSAKAQESFSIQAQLESIDRAYRTLEYERAERMAREVLSEYQMLSIEQLTELHRLLAIILISQNKTAGARRHFEAALSLNPDLRLDPTFVSPKIIDFYEKIRKEYLTDAGRSEADSLAIRYRLIQDPRSGAALRSAVLPGWGQLYVGERSKARWMIAGWSASVGGAVVAHLFREHAIDDGRDGRGWKRARSVSLAAAAGIWLGSYLDALLTRPDESSRTIRLGVRSGPAAQPMAAVRVRF